MEMTSKEFYEFIDELYTDFLAGLITDEEASNVVDNIVVRDIMSDPILINSDISEEIRDSFEVINPNESGRKLSLEELFGIEENAEETSMEF